ncbi:threonine/serine exporter family protein [Methylobacterium sp. NEAU 140]|uniref:threonine/serine exporter family protein n=1 Tax=Methylobacterium sp. NEAU 140 TaxID=3064945 RepID=UPI0027357418|nr:threonine/serine exporter family protein [Methylobacterium sp. NEAU 140]MDP4024616.1 threonine/serine exporter family protein [Methylobacterium sp. NEAU 140]
MRHPVDGTGGAAAVRGGSDPGTADGSAAGGSAADAGTADAGTADRLLVKLAVILFVNGQTSEALRASVRRLGDALGREGQVFAHWGILSATRADGRVVEQHAAEPTGIDIGRVVAAERMIDAVAAGETSAERALAAASAIEHRAPVALGRFAAMAGIGAAALGVIFGASDWLTLCLIAVIAGTGACLRRALSRLSGNPFLQPFSAALLAGFAGSGAAALATALGAEVSHYLLVVCPCMVLVPGPHFLNGAIELARAHIALGTARIAFATLIVVAISTGLLVGLILAASPFPGPGRAAPVPLVHDVVAAGVAVAAYGSFFNMPWRMLPAPIGIGMLAHAARWMLIHQGASLQLGALVACLCVGTLMAPVARRLRMPFGACAFAAVVSLIPGVFMFEAIANLGAIVGLGARATPALVSGVLGDSATAAIVLLAMTTGLIVPKMILDWVDLRRGRP